MFYLWGETQVWAWTREGSDVKQIGWDTGLVGHKGFGTGQGSDTRDWGRDARRGEGKELVG